jgi:aminoglycoside phosphotransferase (APT) family kinase protein
MTSGDDRSLPSGGVLHADELAVDVALVRRLVARSLPRLSHLHLQPLASSGSTNAHFRLGDDLLVRLPRERGGSATIDKEARWLPLIAAGLTTPVPEVLAVGEPAFGYPERWSVTTWLDGAPPAVLRDTATSGSTETLALELARTIAELREVVVPPSALEDPALSSYRGGPLTALDHDFRTAVEACRQIRGLELDLDRALVVWEEALAAEREIDPQRTWYHGDLLAENLLIRDGRLAAVLDFGVLAVGDPTVDLVVAWELLDPTGREVLRRALEVDDASWATSMGWALLIALITFPYYWDTMPTRCADRRTMAAAVLNRPR